MPVTKTTEGTPAERKHWSLDQFEMMRAKDQKDKTATHFSPSSISSGSMLTSVGGSPVARSHTNRQQVLDGVSGTRIGTGAGSRRGTETGAIARTSFHEGNHYPHLRQHSSQPEQQHQLYQYQHLHPHLHSQSHNRKSSLPPPLITNLPALPSHSLQTTSAMSTANGMSLTVPLGLSTHTDAFYDTNLSSTSGNYYACPWILPPIPSFTELGIRFDRSRTSSMNAIANDSNIVPKGSMASTGNPTMSTNGMRINVDGQGYHWSREAQPVTFLSEPETIPDYLPSIFDYIQSDDNEDIILWSTTPYTPGPSSLPSTGSRPQPPSNNSVPPSPSSTGTVYPSNNTDRSVRRWSVGETFKGKDKDQIDNDSRTSNELGGRTADSNQSTDTLDQHKPTRRPTGVSGAGVSGSSDRPELSTESRKPTSTPASISSPSQRVIMAATVEKLVEKLTSEIGVLFLPSCFNTCCLLRFAKYFAPSYFLIFDRLHFLDRLFLDLPSLHHSHGTAETAYRTIPVGTGSQLPAATDCACANFCHPATLAAQLFRIRLYALQGPSPDLDQELGQDQGTPVGD